MDRLDVLAFDADVAYFRAFTERGGGTVQESDGVLTWRSRHPMPFLVNSAVRTDPAITAADVVAIAEDRFTGAFELLCLVGRDDDLLAHAATIEARIGEGDPLQVLLDPAALGEVTIPPDVEVRMVTDAAQVADVAAVNRDATTVFDFPEDLFPKVFERPATVLADDVVAVVAYDRDAPVATAQVYFHDFVGQVGWVATAQRAMRRGLGTIVTHSVITSARERGAEVIALQASPMGAPVYRRMGFVDVGHVQGVVRTVTET
jgi:GNAT superfamily N-acetyltransferase